MIFLDFYPCLSRLFNWANKSWPSSLQPPPPFTFSLDPQSPSSQFPKQKSHNRIYFQISKSPIHVQNRSPPPIVLPPPPPPLMTFFPNPLRGPVHWKPTDKREASEKRKCGRFFNGQRLGGERGKRTSTIGGDFNDEGRRMGKFQGKSLFFASSRLTTTTERVAVCCTFGKSQLGGGAQKSIENKANTRRGKCSLLSPSSALG